MKGLVWVWWLASFFTVLNNLRLYDIKIVGQCEKNKKKTVKIKEVNPPKRTERAH